MSRCRGPQCKNAVLVKSRGLCKSHADQERAGEELRVLKGHGAPKICSHGGCGSIVRSLGYCGRHYRQFNRYGKTWGVGSVGCSVEGCTRPETARALCEYHYFRSDRTEWRLKGGDDICGIKICTRRAGIGLVCSVHRTRLLKYGLTVDELIRLIGEGYCDACGDQWTPDRTREFTIHHDHRCCNDLPGYNISCGKCVVAYLCGPCNIAAGHAGDDPVRLRNIADAIENPTFRRD